MPRTARVVILGTPHHVTQRGARRQQTFFRDEDYLAYLGIAAEAFAAAGVEVWAYCLMPNHVHLIAARSEPSALAAAVGATHVRYTRQINLRERWTGYLWQGRFASFPMDEDDLMSCARYVGLNPVRAGLTARALDWPWSSVAAQVEGRAGPLLSRAPLAARLGADPARFFDLDWKLRPAANCSAPASPGGRELDQGPGAISGPAAWRPTARSSTSAREGGLTEMRACPAFVASFPGTRPFMPSPTVSKSIVINFEY